MPAKRSTAGGEGSREGTRKRAAAPRKRNVGAQAADGLAGDLRAFVGAHPDGWTHDDWLGLLDQLGERGHPVDDADAIGRRLEEERLITRLRSTSGLEDGHAERIAQRYGSVWALRQADPDDLGQAAALSREDAERVQRSV